MDPSSRRPQAFPPGVERLDDRSAMSEAPGLSSGEREGAGREPTRVVPESQRARLVRHGRRARLYAMAGAFVALIVVLTALTTANPRSVKLDWLVGSTNTSLVWIVLAATAVGWLLGILMSTLFRYRTRRPPTRA